MDWMPCLDTYSTNPTIRGLVEVAKAIPIAGTLLAIFDTSAVVAIQRDRERQLAAFLDELSQSGFAPSTAIPEGTHFDIIRAILITTEAVTKSHREEKARSFARLLVAGIQDPPRISLGNEYEDYVGILDEVSWRELEVLALLAKFEEPHLEIHTALDYKLVVTYWSEFLQELTTELSIPPAEIQGLLARLNRTGLYSTLLESLWGGIGIVGNLTGTYYRLAAMITTGPWANREYGVS
jgi:hypothetical protein